MAIQHWSLQLTKDERKLIKDKSHWEQWQSLPSNAIDIFRKNICLHVALSHCINFSKEVYTDVKPYICFSFLFLYQCDCCDKNVWDTEGNYNVANYIYSITNKLSTHAQLSHLSACEYIYIYIYLLLTVPILQGLLSYQVFY